MRRQVGAVIGNNRPKGKPQTAPCIPQMPHPPRKKMLTTCRNHSLTNVGGNSSLAFGQACVMKKGRASLPAPNFQSKRRILRLEDSHALEGPGIDPDDLVVA